MRRYLGKATPKGLVLKAIGGGEPELAYFIAVRGQEFVGPLKRFPGFEPVTDDVDVDTVMFFARRAFNELAAGDLRQWD